MNNIRINVFNRESNAILLYLVETYDKEHQISVTGMDRFTLNQWLLFQASGQGFVFKDAKL